MISVDDLLISGNNATSIAKLKAYLSSYFHTKDLGFLKYFLGIEIAWNLSGFYLCQRKYTLEIISEAGLLGSKPASTLLEPHKLAQATGPLYAHLDQYRLLIGKLIYLTITRPDLTYTVNVLAQFMHAPRQDHSTAIFRLF